MVNSQPIIEAFEQCTHNLLQVLSAFPPENFNRKPLSDAWSAGQVADHLLQLEKRITHIITEPAIATERKPDEKLETIISAMQDSSRKYKAPSFNMPSAELIDQQAVTGELKIQKEKMLEKIKEVDMNELCAGFPHNRLGELTRLEWIHFTICHTERHIRQINTIQEELA